MEVRSRDWWIKMSDGKAMVWSPVYAMGFRAIVAIKTIVFPQAVIKACIINQDVVENHFCQVRACNGQNNHPTWRLQETVQNSIRFGQTTVSRKSNAGVSGMRKISNWRYARVLICNKIGRPFARILIKRTVIFWKVILNIFAFCRIETAFFNDDIHASC